MVACPKCGEENSNNKTHCYKCGASLTPDRGDYKKICPRCKRVYSSRGEMCDYCHSPLTRYDETASSEAISSKPKWPYVVGILIPLVGIILGLIYIGQKEESGPSVLGVSIAAGVVWSLVVFGIVASFIL